MAISGNEIRDLRVGLRDLLTQEPSPQRTYTCWAVELTATRLVPVNLMGPRVMPFPGTPEFWWGIVSQYRDYSMAICYLPMLGK